jgi:preprotein translocase subunit SecE
MKITEYIKQTRTELTHVTWPSRQQTIRFTSLVIVVSAITALILGIADFVFSKLLTLLFH